MCRNPRPVDPRRSRKGKRHTSPDAAALEPVCHWLVRGASWRAHSLAGRRRVRLRRVARCDAGRVPGNGSAAGADRRRAAARGNRHVTARVRSSRDGTEPRTRPLSP